MTCFVKYKLDRNTRKCEITVYNRIRPAPLTFVLEDCHAIAFDIDQELRRLSFTVIKPTNKSKKSKQHSIVTTEADEEKQTFRMLSVSEDDKQKTKAEMEAFGQLLRIQQYNDEYDKYVSAREDNLFYRVP